MHRVEQWKMMVYVVPTVSDHPRVDPNYHNRAPDQDGIFMKESAFTRERSRDILANFVLFCLRIKLDTHTNRTKTV